MSNEALPWRAYKPEPADLRRQLTAAREEIERLKADCKVMAKTVTKAHYNTMCLEFTCPDDFREVDCAGCPHDKPCDCEACGTARKY